ncbi:MAG: Aconitate hydratase, partial [uncultured Phycisphaerae bacterium]
GADRQRGGPGRPRGRVGAERQPQLRGADQPAREGQLPREPAARRRVRDRRHDGHQHHGRAAGEERQGGEGLPARHLAEPAGGDRDDRVRAGAVHVPAAVRQRGGGQPGVERHPGARRRAVRVGPEEHLHPGAAVLPGPLARAQADPAHPRRAGAGDGGGQRDDRPHLAGRRDQEGQPGGAVPARARRDVDRLQQLRLAPRRLPRDDPRHVRQHPPEEPARPRHRGRRDEVPRPARGQPRRRRCRGNRRPRRGRRAGCHRDAAERRRRDEHLRRQRALPGTRRAADRAGRQGLRHGQLARLGGQGRVPAGRQGGDRRELRAHPPQQPGRHGRAAAPVPPRPEPRVARPDRHRHVRDRGRRRPQAAPGGEGACDEPRGRAGRVHGAVPHRHAGRAGVLPQRRHPPHGAAEHPAQQV